MLEKMEVYLEAGTRMVWVAYPAKKVVYVYRRNADGSLTLRKVEGEDVLPGFTLALSDVFPSE
jgi:Uma2 family endonuclease